MSRLARLSILGVALAAVNLSGMMAIAQAQTNDPSTQRPPTQGQVGESYRYYHDALAAQAQRAKDDAVERVRRGERVSQERSSSSIATPARGPAPERPVQPSRQPGWLVLSLGVLAAALALVAGLAMLAARRANRRVRAGQAA